MERVQYTILNIFSVSAMWVLLISAYFSRDNYLGYVILGMFACTFMLHRYCKRELKRISDAKFKSLWNN